MDRGDVSIEKVAEQFLVEGSEIENRDGPYTADDCIPTPKNIPDDFLHSFDQNEHYNYNEKEEEEKNEPQNKDDFSPKEKDGQTKGKMNKKLHNLESFIKQGKSPSEIYKSNLVNFSRSTIFERCKRYKEDSSFERMSGSGRKTKYIDEHIQYTEFNKYLSSITSSQIREKLFDYFEDIIISVGTIYKILKNNDFQWIASSIIPKNGPEQQKIRMNWCKRQKIRNCDDVMFSDEWTFYLKASGGMRWVMKMNSMWCQVPSILIKLIVGEHLKQKEKWIYISLTRIFYKSIHWNSRV